jgi:nitroreductase
MKSENATAAAILDAAIRSRRSVRAFRPDPVPKRLLMEIIETARAAPSNFNSQPWNVHVLVGQAK